MPRQAYRPRTTTREAYDRLNLDVLKPLGPLITPGAPTRKGDLVPLLAESMSRSDVVRRLYEKLDERGKAAVREATHRGDGTLDPDRFQAKYGGLPSFGSSKSPTPLRLFLPQLLPRDWQLPTDLHALLRTFVPEPESPRVTTCDEVPESITPTLRSWSRHEAEPIPVRRRDTDRTAQQEVRALLRLVEAGKVRVSDKTRRPTQATLDAVGGVLASGDFYESSERTAYDFDPASDLTIRPFAWPILLQAADLAAGSSGRLELTAAGRKALGQPPHAILRAIWKKWVGTTGFDEFQRIGGIKGQGKAQLAAVGNRRRAVVETLAECPAGRWIAVDEFFRFLRATGHDFTLARSPWNFYIAEHYYGNFGYEGRHDWELLQGRFILALLFEYAATLGLLDVAYIPPQFARDDYHDRWGTDDYTCMSRYDGLKFLRINALGAWCLGLAPEYQPEPVRHEPRFRVLPNLDVVAGEQAPEPADMLLLDRVAERTSESVWRLDRARILAAVEGGFVLDDLETLLATRSHNPMPQTVQVLLTDLKARIKQLRDLGTARLIECADAETARLLVHDRALQPLCQLAGERRLVFRAEDEDAVRSRLRQLGYVLPPVH